MNTKEIAVAVAEAKRFLERAKNLHAEMLSYEKQLDAWRVRSDRMSVMAPQRPNQAPTKRASLDLSAALARMRRG